MSTSHYLTINMVQVSLKTTQYVPQGGNKHHARRSQRSLRHIPRAWNGVDEDASHPMASIVGGFASVCVLAASSCLSGAAYASECPEYVTASAGDAKGLQFCDLKVGDGDAPVKGSFIKVHYEGRLDSDSASGTFDSSYERRRPLGFSIGTGQV